jgi:hypothetical protein
MKFRVQFKTPDAVTEAIKEAAIQAIPPNVDGAEADALFSEKQDEMLTCSLKWVRYAECITIEFDTEADTATIVPQK